MHLAKNVHLARVDDRAIVLDLGHDRYIGLSADVSRALLGLLDGDGDGDAACKKLLSRGILCTTPHGELREIGQPARRTLWSSVNGPFPRWGAWTQALAAAVALVQIAWLLKMARFSSTVAWLRRQKASARRRPSSGRLGSALTAFATARPWVPATPICRLDAPALCVHLWRNGVDATLVFGVRLDPFAAHCWVQVDDHVLDEPFDAILQYAPILHI